MIHATKIVDEIQMVMPEWQGAEGLNRKFMPGQKSVWKNLPAVGLFILLFQPVSQKFGKFL